MRTDLITLTQMDNDSKVSISAKSITAVVDNKNEKPDGSGEKFDHRNVWFGPGNCICVKESHELIMDLIGNVPDPLPSE